MQLVEVRERVEEIPVFTPKPAKAPAPIAKAKLFDNLRKFELMSFGVPEELVNDVRAADEGTLLDVIAHLPQEAQEALLRLAVGDKPEAPKPALPRPIRSRIPIRNAASALSPTPKICSARSTSRGRNGSSSCIPRKRLW